MGGASYTAPRSGTAFSRPGITAKLAAVPWSLVLLIIAVAIAGTGMLFSITYGSTTEAGLPMAHLTRFGVALVVMMVLALVPLSIWSRLALPVYLVSLILLFAVELAGSVRGGAQRWLELGPLVIQPSEFMKLSLVLMLARYYHMAQTRESSGFLVHVPAAVLILLPAALIFLQPDFGTTLTLLAAGGIIVFLAGLNWRIITTGLVAGVLSVPLVYNFVLEDYQRGRVDTFLEQIAGQSSDALGDGYQIEQAKIAIGSGGLRGKGFLNGTQSQLDYIPEQHTDFVLTVIAEELGFLGVTGLLLAWGVILGWGLYIAMKCSSAFGRYAAAGAVGMVAFYIVFNVGMVVGLLPVVGVPMPLVSYGGTAMLTVMSAFGLVLSVHIHRRETISRTGLF
ncbi:MAG: rod shape-determining protein RodA [Hyphomonadaceae bacterium]|nr:rod shape-determining protein RodA [Hyphomonadaceae bacterium]